MDTLSAANAAFAAKDYQRAATLYLRIGQSSPSAGESTAQTSAITGVALFRAILALSSSGADQQASAALAQAQRLAPNDPWVRLTAQFLDQYQMTASVKPACTQVTPQVESLVGAGLASLANTTAALSSTTLCPVTP